MPVFKVGCSVSIQEGGTHVVSEDDDYKYEESDVRYEERVCRQSEVMDGHKQHVCVGGQHEINLDLQVTYT